MVSTVCSTNKLLLGKASLCKIIWSNQMKYIEVPLKDSMKKVKGF